MTELTLIQAVQRCEDLQRKTGKAWYFEANKGTVKLVEGDSLQ